MERKQFDRVSRSYCQNLTFINLWRESDEIRTGILKFQLEFAFIVEINI